MHWWLHSEDEEEQVDIHPDQAGVILIGQCVVKDEYLPLAGTIKGNFCFLGAESLPFAPLLMAERLLLKQIV